MYSSMIRFLLAMLHMNLFFAAAFGQSANSSAMKYINTYKDIAVGEMQTYKIPASIILAQGILESKSGASELATKANNHFGIKCKEEWTGEKYYYDDDAKGECFRKYGSAIESYRDHSVFLSTRSRYADLFKLDIHDYKGWATGLKQAGYATEPKYAGMLIKIIEDNKLYEFDKLAGTAAGNLSKDSLSRSDTDPDFSDVVVDESGRLVGKINGVRCIRAKPNDSYTTIAKDFGLAANDLLHFNDVKTDHILRASELVYIEAKKNKSSTAYHQVKVGETMQGISQRYGIKLRKLYRMNHMKPGTGATPGHTLYLQASAPIY
jgi:hypothetical protein